MSTSRYRVRFKRFGAGPVDLYLSEDFKSDDEVLAHVGKALREQSDMPPLRDTIKITHETVRDVPHAFYKR